MTGPTGNSWDGAAEGQRAPSAIWEAAASISRRQIRHWRRMKRDSQGFRLSASDLMRFLACPHATRLDVAHLDGEGPEPAEVSEDAACSNAMATPMRPPISRAACTGVHTAHTNTFTGTTEGSETANEGAWSGKPRRWWFLLAGSGRLLDSLIAAKPEERDTHRVRKNHSWQRA